jgi:hypothetical protein
MRASTRCRGRADKYLHLLASSIPPTVAFAMDAVRIVDDVNPFPAGRLLPALQPVLVARGKAVVKAALRLIGQIAKRDSQARPQACFTAANALLHEAPDVQKMVFALLARYGDKSDSELRTKLTEVSGAVVASQRAELRAWIEPAEREQKSASLVLTAPAQAVSKSLVPRTDPSRATAPIATLEDLLHVCGRVLAQPDNPEEIERLIDGMSRIPVPQTPEFARRVGPLQVQALQALGRGQMNHARAPWVEEFLATLILCWLAQADIFRVARREDRALQVSGPSRFLLRRIAALGRDVSSGRSLPLLSAPTHTGAWLDPRELVGRWLAWQKAGVEPSLFEQVLALLRLAPENREDARAAAIDVQGEAGEALRCALGADVPTGATAALWLAAWRSRQPFGDLPEFERAHPDLGPDAGRGARMTWTVFEQHSGPGGQTVRVITRHLHTEPPCPADVDDALLPVLCHIPPELPERTSRELLRWTALLWPANRDAFFAGAVSRLGIAMLWSDVHDRETIRYFGALADPHVKVGEITCLALAMGLSAQDAALRGHARDDLIGLIENDRAEVDYLGLALSKLIGMGEAKCVRWTKSLGEVARVSTKHARIAIDLVQRALQGDPTCVQNLGAVLELLVELLSETGAALTDPAAFEYLSRVTGSGKAARLAKQLCRGAVRRAIVAS